MTILFLTLQKKSNLTSYSFCSKQRKKAQIDRGQKYVSLSTTEHNMIHTEINL